MVFVGQECNTCHCLLIESHLIETVQGARSDAEIDQHCTAVKKEILHHYEHRKTDAMKLAEDSVHFCSAAALPSILCPES